MHHTRFGAYADMVPAESTRDDVLPSAAVGGRGAGERA